MSRRGCRAAAAAAGPMHCASPAPGAACPCLTRPFPARYKSEVRREDKEALRDLVKRQHHYALTPEILRELDSSRSRGESAAAADSQQPVSRVAAAGAGEDPRDLAPIIMMDD